MNLKHILSAGLLLGAATTGDAFADYTLFTAPVAVNAPNPDTNRVIWCLGQNLDTKKSFAPVSTAILGDNGTVIQEIAGTIPPGRTLWMAGATGGSGTIYCKFTVKNKQKVRGFLVVQDEPKGFPTANPTYKHTFLSLEAR